MDFVKTRNGQNRSLKSDTFLKLEFSKVHTNHAKKEPKTMLFIPDSDISSRTNIAWPIGDRRAIGICSRKRSATRSFHGICIRRISLKNASSSTGQCRSESTAKP
ncbi:hypothetical protein L596_029397 [Steinernema carpocapsae]|uniref:Uncharacterized protein n=1 Tax=Steinernema carpocapsae TaxID=34508 RepID=A0A4U5LUI1_STECR|nr:hypothetical protein L596_029397 [Steinernema carpocapsae]